MASQDPANHTLRGVLRNKAQREIWYNAHVLASKKKPLKATYAYGSLPHKVVKVAAGWKLGSEVLPETTPVYEYGFATYGDRMSIPHGAFVFKHQMGGYDLRCPSSVEEKIFSVKDPIFKGSDTFVRSGKKKLRVRCGAGFYRVVFLNLKVKSNFAYIFGSNIKVDTRLYKIPQWMRRRTVVLPHPARTSSDSVSNPFGFTMPVGRPKQGQVLVGGLEMLCTHIGPLCTVSWKGKKYYAHASVIFPYKPDAD